MIQLNHNTSSNTFAVLNSSDSSELIVEFIQDYNKETSYGTASVYTLGQYLIGNITGSQVPTASGLYTVNFYSASNMIDTERAWVSGSDETSINYYTSSNDNGQFYTYDG
jgi:hypothetical protein